MARVRLILLLCLLALLTSPSHSIAQDEAERYFAETGHYVRGLFLEKFNAASDPIKFYGFPITDEFIAPASSPVAGVRVQYFQRARMEYHPENPVGQQIEIAMLGKELAYLDQPGEPPLVLPQNHPACRYFAETEKQVCYAFLAFFENNGGLEQFGYPITNIVRVNDRLVQYFEKARFEWHPEMPAGQRVTITNIGQIYFNLYEDPINLLPANADPNIPNTILDLKVSAFPLLGVMSPNGTQVLYVIVQDQQLRPVPGAQVTLIFRNANGDVSRRVMPGTNVNGFTSLAITQLDQPIGLTEVLVEVNLGSRLIKLARTSFRIWW